METRVINIYIGDDPDVVRKRRKRGLKMAQELGSDVILREIDEPAPRSLPLGVEMVGDNQDGLQDDRS